jgi:acetyl esterase
MPLDPQAKALLDFIGITSQPGVETLSTQEARGRFASLAEMRKQMGAPEFVHSVEDVKIPGPGGEIPIRIYTPDVTKPAPALIYYHGGGWVLGDLESHDHVCRAIANQVGCVVASVDYRLAPEAKFPAAVEDSYAAVEWLALNAASLGIDPERIAVGGDSAGGNLSAVMTQMTRDRRGPKLVYQLLIYPATDMRMIAPSLVENADGPLLTRATMDWFVGHYLRGEKDKTDPLASPLLASDLRGLPPAFILTAECDPLRDEGEDYGRKLAEAGVAVDVKRYAGMPHGFFSFGAALEAGQEAMADATSRLSKAFRTERVKAEPAA